MNHFWTSDDWLNALAIIVIAVIICALIKPNNRGGGW